MKTGVDPVRWTPGVSPDWRSRTIGDDPDIPDQLRELALDSALRRDEVTSDHGRSRFGCAAAQRPKFVAVRSCSREQNVDSTTKFSRPLRAPAVDASQAMESVAAEHVMPRIGDVSISGVHARPVNSS